MLVKVCGMREPDNIRAVEALGIDMMGFIFWPKSSRYVSRRPSYLPTACRRVGVFVDAEIEDICRIAADFALDFIQLHGHESPNNLRQLRSVLGSPTARPSSAAPSSSFSVGGDFVATPIIKAINIATPEDLQQASAYDGLADLLLFDTKGPSAGGNGTKFDWDVLSAYSGNTPFLLSGGIGPDDADRVLSFHHPKCIGIDINSRFESAPAVKDITALRSFLSTVITP